MNGRPTFILSFDPKSEDLPVRNRLDRILNHLASKLWIDMQDWGVVQVGAHLTAEVDSWGGMLYTIKTFTLRYEQTRTGDDAWLPSSAKGSLTGRVLFHSIRERFEQRSSDYKKFATSPR